MCSLKGSAGVAGNKWLSIYSSILRIAEATRMNFRLNVENARVQSMPSYSRRLVSKISPRTQKIYSFHYQTRILLLEEYEKCK